MPPSEYIKSMKSVFSLRSLGIFLFTLLFFIPFTACTPHKEYSSLISEARREVYLAEKDGYSLTAYFGEREYPYAADGKAEKRTLYGEIYLTVPDPAAEYALSFSIDGKKYGGEMSFDSVSGQFYFSQSMPTPLSATLEFSIESQEKPLSLTAERVKKGKELSAESAVERLVEQRQDLFNEKDVGELYVRLTHYTRSYYFIAVIARTGTVSYFLLDARTGEITAER